MPFHQSIVRSVVRFRWTALAALVPALTLVTALGGGCSNSTSTATAPAGDGGTANACTNPTPPVDDDFAGCSTCTFSSTAMPATCSSGRSVNACCAWVQEPTVPLTRSSGLHYFSAATPGSPVDLSCLTTPPAAGTSAMVTLTGYVKLFANGIGTPPGTGGVKIQIFQEGPNGSLGAPVGTPFTTTASGPSVAEPAAWSSKCPAPGGCELRTFTYPGVPTETPLIIQTSDATNAGNWADLYDYNIYISDPSQFGMDDPLNACTTPPCYNPTAVAATDINTVAATVGISINGNDGILAGEVHDCGDVRLSGATVDTDQPHAGPMYYFTSDESDPLPDEGRAQGGLGTSALGLFGALNMATGVPVRVSATGVFNGKVTLIGTYVVQIFPGAVSVLSLRGRRPYQITDP